MRTAIAVINLCVLVWVGLPAAPSAQERPADTALRKSLDFVLDLYVRDGLVYYRALRHDRAKLDAYIAGAATVPVEKLSRDEQVVFWLNTYNAVVLQTVIDHYPIGSRSRDYPPHSIRQIPGAFERATHTLGGRKVTLDQIEKTILPGFRDPRVYFALGRGAVGGGRLRSEAFTPARLEQQLTDVRNECVTRPQCWQADSSTNLVQVSSIFSWHDGEFIEAYAAGAPQAFADRSPVERAVLAFVGPKLLTTEREFLDRNTFKMTFSPFDWTLNDLTGRGGR
ncbi:MAG: DUF547 domain-containing protein [Betaproteobacteria bacterium]